MRSVKVQDRPARHNTMGVDLLVALKVMVLDVQPVDRFFDPRQLIQLPNVVLHVRIIGDPP